MKLNRKNPLLLTAITVAGLGFSASSLHAVTKTWVGANSDWGTAGSWSASGVPANTDDALFTSTGNTSVYLGTAARTISTITFDNTTSATPYTIFLRESSAVSTVRKLTVGNMTVAAGNHTIKGTTTNAADLAIVNGSTINVAASSTLTLESKISGTGLFKTGNGTMVLKFDNGGTGTWSTGTFTVSAGTLDLAANRASGTGTNLYIVSNGATLKLSFLTAWQGSTTGTLTLNGNGSSGVGALYASTTSSVGGASPVILATTSRIGVDPGQTLTIGGNITGTGAAGLEKSGNGILALGGTNSYTGNTTITAGTLSLTGSLTGNTAVSTSGTGIFTQSGTGVLSGSTSFTQGSSGTSVLSLVNNHTGNTTITAGTLSVGVANNLGAAASNLVFDGGTLQVTGTALTNLTSLGRTNPVVFTATKTVGFDIAAASNTFTVGQVLNQTSGGLTKLGAGALILDQTNTYTGNTTITAGTLSLTGSLTGNTAVSTSGTGIFTQSGTGVLSGSTSFTQGSSGTSVLSLVNNHTGGTNISAGTLSFANGALGTTGNITFTGSSTLQWNGANTQDISARLVMTNGATFTIDTVANNVTLATGFGSSSTGALTKVGAGILTLGAANTYTGATTITAGTLSVGVANNLGDAASNLVFNGGTLQVTGTALTSLTSLGRTNPVVFTATKTVGFDIAAANNTFTVGQVLDQTSGGLTKLGAGTLILDQANTYTGTTTVSAGVLNLTGNRTASAGQINVGSEGTAAELNISNGNFTIPTQMFVGVGASLAGNGTVNQTAGAVTFGTTNNQLLVGTGIGSGTYNLSGGSLTTLTKSNRGVMLGVNTGSSGTFILSGTGNLSVASRLQIGRSDSAANNTTNLFSQTGGIATIGTLSIGGASATVGTGINSTMTLTGGTFAATTFDRLAKGDNNTVIINIGGTADVTLPGFGDGTALGAGSTATVNFNGGTLRNSAVNTNYLGAISSAFIQVGGAKFDTTGGNITITQNLLEDGGSTGGGLTKAGSNTLTLTGTNTYTGATNVTTGTLVVDGSTAAGSAVSVASNGTLGGTGTIGGTLALTGVLAPGDAGVVDIETLNAGTTTWNGGSIWNFDLSSVNNTSDKLDITGNLVKGTGTLGTDYVFDFMGSQPVWNTTYTLATFASFTGFTDGFNFTATNLGSGSYSTSYFTLNGTSLTFTAVPEPTSALVGLLVGAGLLRRRRSSPVASVYDRR